MESRVRCGDIIGLEERTNAGQITDKVIVGYCGRIFSADVLLRRVATRFIWPIYLVRLYFLALMPA